MDIHSGDLVVHRHALDKYRATNCRFQPAAAPSSGSSVTKTVREAKMRGARACGSASKQASIIGCWMSGSDR